MGQYWIVVNLSRGRFANPHDFETGAKLLEFGLRTKGVAPSLIAALVARRGLWTGERIVVTGDYDGDHEGFMSVFLKATGAADGAARDLDARNLYRACSAMPSRAATGDLQAALRNEAAAAAGSPPRWFVNEDKMELVDLNDPYLLASVMRKEDILDRARFTNAAAPPPRVGLAVVALLARSSGGGGGDLDHPCVGRWAGDRVRIVAHRPRGSYTDVTAKLD